MASAPADAQLLAAIERAQRESKRARPLLLFGLALLVVAFVLLSIYLNNARHAAERARDDAFTEALAKTRSANEAANALEAARVALEFGDRETALQVIRLSLPQQERVAASPLPEGAELVATSPVTEPDQPRVANVLQEAAAAEEGGLSLPAYPAGADYEVYIQFAGSIARGEIVGLNHALREAGWNVQGPSGERIATATGLNEVRYSNAADRAAAQALAAALTRAGLGGRPVEARQLDIIRAGTLEAWISN